MKKYIPVLMVISVAFIIAGTASATEPIRCFVAPQGRGLTWDGSYLWLASDNDNRIYKLDPENGDIVGDIPSPGLSPRDLAFDGQYLWNVDSDVVFGKIFQIDPTTGVVIRSIPKPSQAVSPSGLTWDGKALWLSGVAGSLVPTIYKIDPSDGSVLGSFSAPAGKYGFSGLAWDGHYLWFSSSVFSPTGFFKIDPNNGEVLKFIEYKYTGEGLAFDNLYLWNNASVGGTKTCQFDIVRPSHSFLIITPPSGTYITTQNFDLSLVVDAPGLPIVSLDAMLDGTEFTAVLESCIIPGTLLSGGQTFRCPSLTRDAVGAGTHTLEVTLDLSDGSSVTDAVTWEVLENTEN
jgi:DNA-binding beta-propeller fold protein YncE